MFETNYRARWADIDMNGHMRHSAFLDYGAQSRVEMFAHFKLNLSDLVAMGYGPVLFREEAVYKHELLLNDLITVRSGVLKMRRDGTKWTIVHELLKGDVISAVITVDGSWLNLKERKITVPPETIQKVMMSFPRTEEFEWLPSKV